MEHVKKTLTRRSLAQGKRTEDFIHLLYGEDYKIESIHRSRLGVYIFDALFRAYIDPLQGNLTDTEWRMLCEVLMNVDFGPDEYSSKEVWESSEEHILLFRKLQSLAVWELTFEPKYRIRNTGLDKKSDCRIIRFCNENRIAVLQAFCRFSEQDFSDQFLHQSDIERIKFLVNENGLRLKDQPSLKEVVLE